MANTHSTTANTKTEPGNALLDASSLGFRKALDLYFVALKADWRYWAGRSKASPATLSDRAQAAAAAWAICTGALQQTRDLPGAHPDLRSAAGYLLRGAPQEAPTERSLGQLGAQVLKLARDHRATPSGLQALLEEAGTLLFVHSANLAVTSLQTRVANPNL